MNDFNKLTDAQKLEAMRAYAKREEQKSKERRYWARQAIMLRKADAAGITVSEEEVNEYMKTMRTKNR